MNLFLDMLYPRNCIGCSATAPETFRYICWDCWSDAFHVEPPFCDRCGDPVAGAVDHDYTCFSCSKETPAFDRARSASRYDGIIGEALRLLKYQKALWIAPDMGEILHRCMKAEYPNQPFDLIVPVPLHHVRRRDRGFNQSAVLAKELGRRIGCRSSDRLLRRIRPTTTQTHLTAPQRLSNVKNAFHCRKVELLAERHILLIDDVMTTGATVNACAKALKESGAASVHVLTVARG